MNEEELVSLAVKGDTDAYAELYDKYKDKLYNYAYYKLSNSDDAMDVVQECVLKAYENIRLLKSPKAFSSWLFKILYCCCNQKIKEQIDKRNTEDIDGLVNISSSDGEKYVAACELKNALEILDKKDQSIVLLSVIAGLSSKEIAKVTKLTPNNVRQRLKRSLNKMKNELS